MLYPLSYEGRGNDRIRPVACRSTASVTVLVVYDDSVIVQLLRVNFEL